MWLIYTDKQIKYFAYSRGRLSCFSPHSAAFVILQIPDSALVCFDDLKIRQEKKCPWQVVFSDPPPTPPPSKADGLAWAQRERRCPGEPGVVLQWEREQNDMNLLYPATHLWFEAKSQIPLSTGKSIHIHLREGEPANTLYPIECVVTQQCQSWRWRLVDKPVILGYYYVTWD